MILSPAHAARVAESDRLNRYRVQWLDGRNVMTTHYTTLSDALSHARRVNGSIFDRTGRRAITFGQNSA